MTTPAPTESTPRRWPSLVLLVCLVAGAGVGVGAWAVWFRHRPDPVAAAHANARGIGHLNQFEDAGGYAAAIADFEEAIRYAPDWTPAKINLGIALLNTQKDDNLTRAAGLFEGVLKADPDNAYAHYNLGLIHFHKNRLPEAHKHFGEVTRIDPQDAHGWYYRAFTHPDRDSAPEAKEWFRKALDRNPYLNSARHSLAGHSHDWDAAKSAALLEEFKALNAGKAAETAELKYTASGKYGTAIGASPAPPPDVGLVPMFEKYAKFNVKLAAGTAWAGDADGGDLWKAVRSRFGGTVVRLDYDKDGKPDLLLLGAVLRGGKLGDLLLHNDGNGTFTDTTTAAHLTLPGSFGCAVADYDHDGYPDLLFTGEFGVRLFRSFGGRQFLDATVEAGLAGVKGVFLGCGWLDIDQDSDLDAIACRYATTPADALARLAGKGTGDGAAVVLVNAGEAKPVEPAGGRKPLGTKFQTSAALPALAAKGPAVGVVASDVDADRDPDLIALADGDAPATAFNDRLFRLRRGDALPAPAARWNGGLVLHANADEQPDLLLLPAGEKPLLLVSQSDTQATKVEGRFAAGGTDSPALTQAHATDLDLDGRADVVGVSASRTLVFLQGDGKGKLHARASAFGPAADAVPNLLSAFTCDLDGDGNADLVTWSAGGGLAAFRNLGNGFHGLRLELTGMRGANDDPVRTNADGIGSSVVALAGAHRAAVEYTTLSAGLGQSSEPLVLGLGKNLSADALRLRWPDAVPQGEVNVKADHRTQIVETDRRGGSCPVLLTWDGTRFRYVTDFLGAGTVGEMGADGTTRPPRPEEAVKIEAGWLAPKDGKYVVKVAEPMDELMYLDHLRLEVIDHPTGVEVYPDERFHTSGPPPTGKLLAFRERFAPLKATDHRGRDVTDVLRTRDHKAASGFLRRNWIGFAEDHFVELDFGDQLAGTTGKPVYLVLAGWIDYPYPETIFAAGQAGVPMTAPVLERQTAAGTWEVVADLGFPAGLPKVMTRELPSLAGAKGLKLRLRTNLQIHWDQVYLSAAEPAAAVTLPVTKATLTARGFMQEVSPGRGRAVEYNDDRIEPVAVTKWRGKLTRTGDVTELLTGHDDRFVVTGPGDEAVVEFDAAKLPPVPAGFVRSFVLRTFGYVKDAAPFTATGGQVGPLPHRGMSSYPDGAKPSPELERYDREWNTRPAGGR